MGTFNMLGFNLRLSDIQAAVGVAQMAKLDRLLDERKSLANRYHDLLANVPDIARPAVPPKCGHTYQSYVIRVLKGGRERRNAVMNHMQKAGIQTGIHYPVPLHLTDAYQALGYPKAGSMPVTEKLAGEILSLPMYPELGREQIDYVVQTVREFSAL